MNHARLNILTFGLLIVLFPAIILGYIPWWALFLLPVAYAVVLGWGVFDIGSQFFIRTYWKGPKGKVAITFDDGPHPVYTPRILQVLDQERVPATFFTIGKHAAQHPDILKAVHAAGHLIGNHTYSHAYVFSQKKAEEQIGKGEEVIRGITGKRPRYFRPPFGVMNPKIARAVSMLGKVVIGWDLRTRDGARQSKKAILRRVRNRIGRSSILLFHDTNPVTAEALEEVIHLCRKNGTEIVPLSELIGVEPYHD